MRFDHTLNQVNQTLSEINLPTRYNQYFQNSANIAPPVTDLFCDSPWPVCCSPAKYVFMDLF